MNGSTRWFFLQQCTLQYSFFQAQWEEYYTHVLPHSTGQIGVTEVNYGLGVLTIFMGFVDREALWLQQLKDVLPYAVSSCLPPWLVNLELRYVSTIGWTCMVIVLVLLSFLRVCNHLDTNRARFGAACNLLSPLIIGVCPFLLPVEYIRDNTRYISVAVGLLFSHITKKQVRRATFSCIIILPFSYLFDCDRLNRFVKVSRLMRPTNFLPPLICSVNADCVLNGEDDVFIDPAGRLALLLRLSLDPI